MSTVIDEINSLALHNVSKYGDTSSIFSFTRKPAEFGTNNHTTHRICSLLNLFVSMSLVPKVGVTEVAGSSFIFGIGTIAFIIADNDGLKHKTTLDNVI